MSKDSLLSDEELKQECLTRVALQEYGTTPSNLSGEQLAKIGFASIDLYQFINTQKKLYAESVQRDEMNARFEASGVAQLQLLDEVEALQNDAITPSAFVTSFVNFKQSKRNELRAEQRARMK